VVATVCSFPGEEGCLQKPQRLFFFLLLFASCSTPKPLISQFVLTPGKSSILGKACVHGPDSCFIPSLREVSSLRKVTHAIAGNP